MLLKAFIRKYIRNKSIFENNDHTISLDKALTFTNDFINISKPKSFEAIKTNLFIIEKYRNDSVHFYNESLDPYIFMLVARASLNFVEFMKEYFSKDIISEEGIFIMPLGFKLPFKPEDFLSKSAVKNINSEDSKRFVDQIIENIDGLKKGGVEDSIVLGFNIYLESVKKMTNSDLLVAITGKNEANINITNPKKVILTDDPNAQKIYLTDEEILNNYPMTTKQLTEICKEQIKDFKVNDKYNKIKSRLRDNPIYAHIRFLNPGNPRSARTYYYSDRIIPIIKDLYEQK